MNRQIQETPEQGQKLARRRCPMCKIEFSPTRKWHIYEPRECGDKARIEKYRKKHKLEAS